MDIEKAKAALMAHEGATIYTSSQERAVSFKRETEWFVRVHGQHEGEDPYTMEMKLPAFANLYRQQKFTTEAPAGAPIEEPAEQVDDGEI